MDDADPCTSGTSSNAYPYDGILWGQFGKLGMDSNHTISWTLSKGQSTNSDNFPVTTGSQGVFSMPEKTTIGSSTTISYKCNADPATVDGGHDYSGGAPTFSADATVAINLLAD